VKVSELARDAGVSVATIKYYVREGLLHPGRLTSATQAEYDASHVERLGLIRVLRDVGGVPVASIGAVLDAIDDTRLPLWETIRTAHHSLALHPAPEPVDDAPGDVTTAREEVLQYLVTRGWDIDDGSPALGAVAEALVAARELWGPTGVDLFEPYIETVDTMAGEELSYIDDSHGKSATVQQVIVGTVVFERALVALRRLAQQHHSNTRFKPR
jgi:DNA-binding transcriptional MerR regulator